MHELKYEIEKSDKDLMLHQQRKRMEKIVIKIWMNNKGTILLLMVIWMKMQIVMTIALMWKIEEKADKNESELQKKIEKNEMRAKMSKEEKVVIKTEIMNNPLIVRHLIALNLSRNEVHLDLESKNFKKLKHQHKCLMNFLRKQKKII